MNIERLVRQTNYVADYIEKYGENPFGERYQGYRDDWPGHNPNATAEDWQKFNNIRAQEVRDSIKELANGYCGRVR